MGLIPDSNMQSAATEILELLGSDWYFTRASVLGSAINVYSQPLNSQYLRAVVGVDNVDDFTCFASYDADIRKGDRVSLTSGSYSAASGAVWHEVTSLSNWGSHIEFTVRALRESI